MNEKELTELTELLSLLAVKDLAEGADIYDHPCSSAVRAIHQLREEVKVLREEKSQLREDSQELRKTIIEGMEGKAKLLTKLLEKRRRALLGFK